jgi:hypothetical protein
MSSAHELKLVALLYEVILCLWGNREWYCNKIMKDFLNTWGPNWLAIELSNFIFAPIADLLVKGIYPTVEILKTFDCGKHRDFVVYGLAGNLKKLHEDFLYIGSATELAYGWQNRLGDYRTGNAL